MKVNTSIEWDYAPARGRIVVHKGRLIPGNGIMVGWGEYNNGVFSFTGVGDAVGYEGAPTGICRICVQIDADNIDSDTEGTTVSITNTENPFNFALKEVLAGQPKLVHDSGIRVRAELDIWEHAPGRQIDPDAKPFHHRLPRGFYMAEGFTEEQIKQYGPPRKPQVISTDRHVYETPMLYENVTVKNIAEVDVTKGIELIADLGSITIEEEKPILGVTVVGSGCKSKGYNICEWWDEGESIENLKNQLVKRQRVDNLNGTHPQIYHQLLLGHFPGLTFQDVNPEMKDTLDCLKKQSRGFYEGIHMGYYENTVYFRVGPPYPHKITIRGGTKTAEEPGMSTARAPGEYAFRIIETTVINKS